VTTIVRAFLWCGWVTLILFGGEVLYALAAAPDMSA
jgi:hypothetical protein